jgi:diketogulonate reductase-like aldo/keto reductase
MKAKDPTLNEIAKRYEKQTGHVLIRYCLPKSDTLERIVENANVYDFELTAKEMEKLDGLDQGSSGAIVEAMVNTL